MRRIFFFFTLALTSGFAAAQSGSPDALYERGINAITGVGATSNEAEGVDYFRRSAGLGFGPSQIALGYYYETGTVLTKDPAQALDLYRKAALVGDPLAGWLAGRMYFLGNGTPRDLDAALKYFKIAADRNNGFGAYYLARLMADRDASKSPALYKIAADQGLIQAQYFYGKVLKEGHGISQNRAEAYSWLYVAADAGYAPANAELNELDSSGALTQEQIAEARNKARDMEQYVIRAVSARGCEGWNGESDEFPTPPPPQLQRFCH